MKKVWRWIGLVVPCILLTSCPDMDLRNVVADIVLRGTTVPAAPSGLSASAVSVSSIRLAWIDNANNETGFKVERSPDGTSGWTLVKDASADSTSWDDTGLNTATTYYYRVTGYNAVGDSAYSNIASETIELLWARTYGGSLGDHARSIRQTTDGGYVVAGSTASFGAGSNDYWVIKLDEWGVVSWQKSCGGVLSDVAKLAQQTSDGGYIVAGTSNSFSFAQDSDFWLLKLDASGGVTWQIAYGGGLGEDLSSVGQTTDGGYIVSGYTYSAGSGGDVWVLKLDSSGAVAWQTTYGGVAWDYSYSLQQTIDGGYIIAGGTQSFGAGSHDIWLLKLDSAGTVSWNKTYGGAGSDFAVAIQQTSDSGYVVVANTGSFGAGNGDIWVLKLDASGDISWQKTYGGTGSDWADSIWQAADGGYILAGGTGSFGAGSSDIWVLKLDANGGVAWQKALGGIGNDFIKYSSIQQTIDGGYILAGGTDSFGAGSDDLWVLRIPTTGQLVGASFMADSSATVMNTVISPASPAITTGTVSGTPPATHGAAQNSVATVQTQYPPWWP